MSTTAAPTCALCGQVNLAAAHYSTRGLAVPAVCRDCHQKREARLVELPGAVEAATTGYAFILADDGVRYFASAAIIRAADAPLLPGVRVVIAVDLEAKVQAGKKPRCHRLRRA